MRKGIGAFLLVAVASLALLLLAKVAARRSDVIAVRNLRLIVAAESSHFEKHGRFAPLSDLGDSGALPKDLAVGESGGHRFELELNASRDQYILRAISHTGHSREVWSNPVPPNGLP